MMVGNFGKTLKGFKYLFGEAGVILLIPLVVFFLFLVIMVQSVLSGREN